MPSVTLPYYRQRQSLPADLPTIRDIEDASEVLPCIRDSRFGRVVVVRQLFVVKYGLHVSENEGHALLFIEEHLHIPAPRLYVSRRPHVLPGDKISTREGSPAYLDRARRGGQAFYSWWTSCNLGPYLHRFFRTVDPDPLINGPFESSAEVGSALARHSQQNWDTNNTRSFTSEWFARHLQTAFGSYKSVFTHADLHPQNILVREDVTGAGEEQQRRYVVSAVVDWESAGWYPDYWEYAGSFVDFDWIDDWPEKYELVVETRPLEAALLKFVRQDLDF